MVGLAEQISLGNSLKLAPLTGVHHRVILCSQGIIVHMGPFGRSGFFTAGTFDGIAYFASRDAMTGNWMGAAGLVRNRYGRINRILPVLKQQQRQH